MVRMASIKFGTGTVSRPTTVSTATGTTLGGGSTTTSSGGISIASKIQVPTNYGPSVNQISGTGSGLSIASKIAAPASTTSSNTSSNTNYKLSIASMLLAMKNQALGSLSLGGSKAGAGGTITENYSGINLG